MVSQQTISNPFSLSGVGLHSGAQATVTVSPAQPNAGRYFVYQGHIIPASLETVGETILSTQLKAGGASVRTVEHLLAALWGMEIDNAQIDIDSAEIPILDGSARPWVEAIASVGTEVQPEPRHIVALGEVVSVQQGDAFAIALPSDVLRFTYGIEFPTRAIGTQWFSWMPSMGNFASEVAPARTFTMAQQVEQLQAMGLIKGGSLDNAIVCNDKEWLNPPLRFNDEPCRHKLLDLIGDISLLGWLPKAHIVVFKASHALHAQFAQALLSTEGDRSDHP
ncbi:MAG: UDP-3-O-acyl-N-acetylglucosamine deacetylase [Pseudanabaena sp. RU_4_16]|nr:UDP-3-O-acyl-N-acetylglucosamine deacetylase [Pseudanabaena sp. RU_4_16]